ncbi:preprotein translocase subunit TatB [Rhodococcus sp. Leaf7]|uniref:Sec-independent protein translocase protein TatB n=1 Tax=unclassified Rhodococcus (in: high G+C Gram-positive bacteria) TaxID=192944 RepID=UPI0005AC727A|nr:MULTISPECIES: Sec-independent protein translocase protein TatB [unclassified Rhodococcus (in: high G+C Gram-positive bacteria)]KIQ17184.1 preprotein translocase subunit TatB [Rhodococcus sp. MEB064]KQU06474.1 preprotein translocase subunit TatB [Rhodococcus sp. Leaf7]KQU41992.1 preprotein translocase subunit TatB [Rhodococcus sp. Leaf247]
MFSNIGWGEMMVLLVVALVVLGPERLPGAITWTTKSLRQVRDYASGASQQLKDELGTDFDDLRKPLADLNQLRGMSPRAVITKHLLDGDDSIFTGKFDEKPQTPAGGSTPNMSKSPGAPLPTGERPPIDPDAT